MAELRRIMAFVAVGGSNTALTFGAYQLLLLVCHYQLAWGISWVIGVAFGLVANAKAVFRADLGASAAVRIVGIYAGQYAFGSLAMTVLVDHLGVSAVWAPLLVVALVVPPSYLAMRSVFRGASRPSLRRQHLSGWP